MGCAHCAREFSLFHREYACPACGFSHCSSCLKYKVVSPKTGRQEKVCLKCHTLMTTTQRPAPPPSPPKALQQRLEKLQPSGVPKGLAAEDQRIAERLERLHKERKDRDQLPSEDEVRARLNRLKGVAHSDKGVAYSDKGAQQADTKGHQAQFYQPPDARTATEQVNHLVTATSAKVDLEARHVVLSPEDDIAGRLARLRGEPKPDLARSKQDLMPDPNLYLSGPGGDDQKAEVGEEGVDEVARLMAKVEQEAEREAKAAIEEVARDKAIQEQLARLRVRPAADQHGKVDVEEEDDEDEDELEEEERLIKQLMAEARLDQDLGGGGGLPKPPGGLPGGSTAGEPEELPWCVICNEDALVRCLGCGGDLYCTACYKEFHVGEDPNEHRVEKFKR